MDYPKQRDIIWIDFDPLKGKEIKKRRPALVVSKDEFNERTGFCIVCPITSTRRSFATYVASPCVPRFFLISAKNPTRWILFYNYAKTSRIP